MTKDNQLEVKKETVQDIITDLSYSWSTPEAQEFHHKMDEKKYTSAKTMLKKEGLNKEQVNMVIDYFKKKKTQKKKIIEYYPSEYANLEDGDSILVSYGGSIIASMVRENERITDIKGNCFFDGRSEYIALSDATQVWKVEKI